MGHEEQNKQAKGGRGGCWGELTAFTFSEGDNVSASKACWSVTLFFCGFGGTKRESDSSHALQQDSN